jgi:NAD(P)H-hydrate epimerase
MIPHFKGNTPFIDLEKKKEVDKAMIDDYGFSLMQMMELAGLNLAILARNNFLKNKPSGKKVIVVAGPGGNGGGVMVAARHLHNWGADVSLVLSSKAGKFNKDTIYQFSILKKLNIEVIEKIEEGDLIIDGMIGYGLSGNPKGKIAELITQINESGIPVLALDAPSGLDLSTGKPSDLCVKAKSTVTLAIPKSGHFRMPASKYIGELFLADISVPMELYKAMGIETKELARTFQEGSVVKINKLVIFS